MLLGLAATVYGATTVVGPQLLSVFPLGVSRESLGKIKVRGINLGGTYAIAFDCSALTGAVKSVEETEAPGPQAAGKNHEVTVEVRIHSQAAIGTHAFRLVTPAGVSDPLSLRVEPEPVILESAAPHHDATQAQMVTFPAAVAGRIAAKGELDYYSFDATGAQELHFEVLTANGLLTGPLTIFNEPHLDLYELAGSWFDPKRARRLAPEDVTSFFYYPETEPRMFHFLPRLVQRFKKGGRYLIEVGATDGQGGPDYSYLLRIIPASQGVKQPDWSARTLISPDPLAWQERDFARPIQPNRLHAMLARAVRVDEKKPVTEAGSEALPSVHEKEPNSGPAQAGVIPIPAILEGVISCPEDEDYFKFQARPGDQLAFEIETPEQHPPYFSPRFSVVDAAGRELFSNVYRKIDGNGVDWTKSVEPKTVFTFAQGGEFYLKIRDLTTQRGAPNFAYRVLVRRQVPHIGEIAFKTFPIKGAGNERYEDRINLVAGESRSMTVVSDREEGFEGQVVISAEGLPQGVTVSPALAPPVEVYSKGAQGQGLELFADLGAPNKERYRPRRITATMVLSAAADCPEMKMPVNIRFMAQPILGGKAGARFPFQEMPLMIVQPAHVQGPMRLDEKQEIKTR